MRIALVGKGGSGKTTLTSLLFQYLENKQKPVLAIDADINQHLAEAIRWDVTQLPDIGNHLTQIKHILKGNNPLIQSSDTMIKTTPPATGSHFITLSPSDNVLQNFAQHSGSAYFMHVGGFQEEDLGQRCFHAKTGGVELLLNHLIDQAEDTILVDMTAGADAFASGLFSRFDLTVIVVEPTLKSLSVYKQYKDYAQHFKIPLCVIGNKIETSNDITFLKQSCSDDFIGYLTKSHWVKNTEKGINSSIDDLEPHNLELLQTLLDRSQNYPRNWKSYWQWGIHFHKLNAQAWANADIGQDLTKQIDEDFLTHFQPEHFIRQQTRL